MIAKGAEAEIFQIGKKLILKRRVRKKYRVEQLDRKLRESRTKREAKVLFSAKMAGVITPKIMNIDMGKTEITLGKINGTRLREWLVKHKDVRRMLFAVGEALAKLHNADIVHGDFSTANVMVGRNGNIAVIDFGLSDFSSSIEDKATDLLIFRKSTNEKEFSDLLKGYKKTCLNYKQIFRQLDEMEKRGRYVARAQAI